MRKLQNNTNEIRQAVISGTTVNFSCPGCGAETTAQASRLECLYRVKVRCACQHIYIVEINNRDKRRKRVDLPARCIVTRRNCPERILDRFLTTDQNCPPLKKNLNARVIDLSYEGLGLLSSENQLLKKGDVINLAFTLDNPSATEVKQEYEVKNIINNRIGCSIIGDNISLDSYLLA